MFGLGFSEILILAVLGLVLLGPDQLPEVARTLGRFFNDLKRSTDEIKDEFKKSTMSSNNLLEDIRRDINTDSNNHNNSHDTQQPEQLEMDTEYVAPQQTTELEKNGKKPESH